MIKAELIAGISRNRAGNVFEFGVQVLAARLVAVLDRASGMYGAYAIVGRLLVVASFLSL
jgi:hypothetical protein